MTQSVLLVDDERSIVDILSTWLENEGYTALTADNGLTGLLTFHDAKPDLVIADVLMPQIDGFELCRMMRELSTVPIMILSGMGKEADREFARRRDFGRVRTRKRHHDHGEAYSGL